MRCARCSCLYGKASKSLNYPNCPTCQELLEAVAEERAACIATVEDCYGISHTMTASVLIQEIIKTLRKRMS